MASQTSSRNQFRSSGPAGGFVQAATDPSGIPRFDFNALSQEQPRFQSSAGNASFSSGDVGSSTPSFTFATRSDGNAASDKTHSGGLGTNVPAWLYNSTSGLPPQSGQPPFTASLFMPKSEPGMVTPLQHSVVGVAPVPASNMDSGTVSYASSAQHGYTTTTVPLTQPTPAFTLVTQPSQLSEPLAGQLTRRTSDLSSSNGSTSMNTSSHRNAQAGRAFEEHGSDMQIGASSVSPSSSNDFARSSPDMQAYPAKHARLDLNEQPSAIEVGSWPHPNHNLVQHPGAPSSMTLDSVVPIHDVTFRSGTRPNQAQPVFKTSAERRERNKASQRESRRRRQDRLETLENENAALRKALEELKQKKKSDGDISVGSDPFRTSFSGSIHLGGIELHLNDTSADGGYHEMISPYLASGANNSSESGGDSDSDDCPDSKVPGRLSVNGDKRNQTWQGTGFSPTRDGQQTVRRQDEPTWQLALKESKFADSIASIIVVPELVLYNACRIYYSLVLPFTTRKKSGIVNLRSAKLAPSLVSAGQSFPRFKLSHGQGLEKSEEYLLPANLMPTEAQIRVGFHPIELAVIPFPTMRDKVLSILAAFNSLEGLYSVPDGLRVGERDERLSTELPSGIREVRPRTAVIADMSSWPAEGGDGSASMAMVVPDRSRIYTYGIDAKPKGSAKLRNAAQLWLDEFFGDFVASLRIWCSSGDVFDKDGFELRESFFQKYPTMVDAEILAATNRWRRARGEKPIRLG